MQLVERSSSLTPQPSTPQLFGQPRALEILFWVRGLLQLFCPLRKAPGVNTALDELAILANHPGRPPNAYKSGVQSLHLK